MAAVTAAERAAAGARGVLELTAAEEAVAAGVALVVSHRRHTILGSVPLDSLSTHSIYLAKASSSRGAGHTIACRRGRGMAVAGLRVAAALAALAV